MGRLEGKVAIVTGGSRGLGAGAVEALCAEGATVMIADVLAEAGEASAEALRERGYRAHFIALDVRDAAAWAKAVETTMDGHGRLDCLVNNAGINITVDFEEATPEQFDAIIGINLRGAFLGTQAVIPAMRAGGGGSIINVASNSTGMIVPAAAIYAISKSGLASLTKSTGVHCALKGYNIRANSIHPGPHQTEMMTNPEVLALPEVRALLDAIPMGRLGRPDEFGKLVVFLASDDSSYMTTSELFLDGGLTTVSFADPGRAQAGA